MFDRFHFVQPSRETSLVVQIIELQRNFAVEVVLAGVVVILAIEIRENLAMRIVVSSESDWRLPIP